MPPFVPINLKPNLIRQICGLKTSSKPDQLKGPQRISGMDSHVEEGSSTQESVIECAYDLFWPRFDGNQTIHLIETSFYLLSSVFNF